MSQVLLACAIAATAATFAGAQGLPQRPDPALTPGATLAATTNDICQTGYTRTARHVTSAIRRTVFQRYRIEDAFISVTTKTGGTVSRSNFEVDHLIPLELGGSNAIENLWPESYSTTPWNAHLKDRLENRLHRMVCVGEISLKDAQTAIATDWIAAYKRLFEKTTTVP